MQPNPNQQVRHGHGPMMQPLGKTLRIGVILGGKIIEERLLRGEELITIGQSAKNTFAVPLDALPRSWPLFQRVGAHFVFNFSDQMDGRISDASGRVMPLDGMKQGLAMRRGEMWSMQLSDTARGKVTLGDLTVLFQLVTAPPLRPKPMLPKSVRGSVADRVDPYMAIILAVSLVAHFSVATYLWQRDTAAETTYEKLQANFGDEDRVASISFTQPMRPVDQGPSTTPDEGKKPDEPGGGEDKGPKKPKPGDGKPKGPSGPPSEAQVRETVANQTLIRVLSGGPGGVGSRYSDMSGKDAGTALDKSLKNVGRGDGKISSRGEGGLGHGSRGPQSGEIGTGSGPGVEGPGDTGNVGGDKAEVQIKTRATVEGGEALDETTLDPSSVASTIRTRYLQGIKRCHQQALKLDPKAGGRVNIQFTVGKSGGVTGASVDGFDGTVDACIKALVMKWRFAIPKDDAGAPTTAEFSIPLILKPE